MSLADRVAVMKDGVIVQYDAPMKIYAEPATTFVGGFIGNPPMNFVSAPVADAKVTIGGHSFSAPSGARGKVTVGIRAEDLEVGFEGIGAKVKVVEPLGPNQLITLAVDESTVRLDAPNTLRVASGQSIRIAPRAGALRWFDAETGARLQ
jgi:multiple sugar transport system ATP-binding protein